MTWFYSPMSGQPFGAGAVFGFQTIAFIESGAGLNEANLLTDVINNIEFSVA